MILDKDLGIWVMKQSELDEQLEASYWRGYNDMRAHVDNSPKENELKFYKLYTDAILPTYATPGSACFDIYAHVKIDEFGSYRKAYVHTQKLTKIRTGLSAIIPEGYSLRIHPRSGLAFKSLTTLVNSEGIIDSDYTGEIQIGLYRFWDGSLTAQDNEEPLVILHGDRIAQGELVKNLPVTISEASIAERDFHRQNSQRKDGGFGSTGK
jgi:dUTP pyrophosphatase